MSPEQRERKRQRMREYYRENREVRLARAIQYHVDNRPECLQKMRTRGEAGRAFIDRVKTASGCMACGENGAPGRLHFHHVAEKRFAIGANRKASLVELIREMARCIVLCVDCHEKEHAA